jgi:hypothetical protein
MSTVSINMLVPAHYDGHQILIDAPVKLKPNLKFFLDIPDDEQSVEEERREWEAFSLANFAQMYEDEPDIYTDDMIIKRNPHYRGDI